MADFFYDGKGKLYYGEKEEVPLKVTGPLLFVYGTLRFYNKHLLKDAQLVKRNVRTRGGYYLMLYKSLPVMVHYPTSGGGGVVGDVYQVTDEILREIDAFKLKGKLYSRNSVTVGDYEEFKCTTYIYPKAGPAQSEMKEFVHETGFHGDYGKYLESLINDEELLNG